MTFWTSSTKEQRIAQIMGGIECGMSSRHIGTNCRTTQKAVLEFCRRNGIKIPVPKRVKRAAVAAPKPKPAPKHPRRKQIRRPETPAYTPTASHRDAWTIFAPSMDDRFLETFEDVDA